MKTVIDKQDKMGDHQQQLNNLIKWLSTFDLQAPHSSAKDISDGVALAEVLTQIAPEWFSAVWKAKIKTDVGANWRLRVSNMKKIVEAVMEYYMERLNQQLSGYVKPDATKIGEHCDSDELRRLLQLILGCAVNCDQKQQYITRMKSMDETVQRAIMQSIQQLERALNPGTCISSDFINIEPTELDVADEAQQRLFAELQATVDIKDQLAQRCHELDQQLSLLQEEKTGLIAENKKLQERLDEFENPEDSGSILKYSGLRKQVEALKDELFKMETSRDDYRLKVELLEKEVLELQSRQEDLQKAADEANHLKDEVDALRETADKVTKYEITIESYKKKMEDLSDLKRQVKILEDMNVEYLQVKLDYEEEVKRTTMLRSHLEACKQQLTEVHHRLDEQSNKYDRLEFEGKKMEAKLGTLQRERDRLIIERDALKETNDELKCTQLQAAENVAKSSADSTGTEMIPLEVKEKLLCLQLENKMLKMKLTGNEDKLPSVQALLEDSVERLNMLRGQNRKANQRIMELETKLEEAMGNQVTADNKSDNVGLNQKVSQLQDELRKTQTERERLVLQLEERESALQAQKQKLFSVQEKLTRKEFENAALEERYKKYIEKAKSVIKSLDPKQSSSTPSEVVVLRNQLLEQRKMIEEMERSMKETRLLREMEEKLMVSAFHRLGLNCHREIIDQRLAALSSGQGQSFLARQRQPSTRRHPPYNSK